MARLKLLASLKLLLFLSSYIPVAKCFLEQEAIGRDHDIDTEIDGSGHSSILVTEIQRTTNQSLLWGPYRPQVYFGLKPRLPDSLITGLMWANVEDYPSFGSKFRHTCEQGDNMAGYGWEEYDIRTGGRQIMRDAGNMIDLETSFVKVEGGENGGNWGVRIKGTLREGAPRTLKTALWFYAGLEGEGTLHLASPEEDILGLEGDVTMEGNTPGLGDFKIDITRGPETNRHPGNDHELWQETPLDRTMYKAWSIPREHVWKTKDILYMTVQENLQRLITRYGKDNPPPPWFAFTLGTGFALGNLHMIQKTFEGPFEFHVLYSSSSAPTPMTSDLLAQKIETTLASFEAKFDKVFQLQKPFDKPEYKEFAKNMFSNLLGGIGFFHGTSLVDRSYAAEYDEEDENFWEGAGQALKDALANAKLEGPTSLFTSIPSRPFFPRGFYWDEGFHLLPVLDFDPDLALEIVKSWFSLVDDDGWLAREQILGDEARSKVPEEFQIQYPHYANPPTLFLVLTSFIEKLEKHQASKGEQLHEPQEQQILGIPSLPKVEDITAAHLEHPELGILFLRQIYPLLRRHYFWFRKTQLGDLRTWDRPGMSKKEGFRWRGRTPTHCLTSGLDDYPRPRPPHTGELHVDLISWVSLMTRCIRRIAQVIGNQEEDLAQFALIEAAVNKNIDALHWNESEQLYCDATIDEYEEHVHVCHKGYISIFPFLVGGIINPDSPRLKPMLDLIRDPNHLWSDYGIRSLSKSDSLYGTEENYWRGPIWININYLALQRLYDYATIPGPEQKYARNIYVELRKNLVENIYKEWKRTGYAWEQYNAEDGSGQRTKHFLGWTSLVVKMMGMEEEPSLIPKF